MLQSSVPTIIRFIIQVKKFRLKFQEPYNLKEKWKLKYRIKTNNIFQCLIKAILILNYSLLIYLAFWYTNTEA